MPQSTEVHCGGEHSLFLRKDGAAFSTGACGLGWSRALDLAPSLFTWRRCVLPEPAKSLASGYYHNLAIGASGRVYSWGCGTFLEGYGDGCKPALGQGAACEDKGEPPSKIAIEGAIAAACGAYHSVVMTKQHVLTFGNAQLGQLGRVVVGDHTDTSGLPIDPMPRPVDGFGKDETPTTIGAGFYNTFVTTDKGELWGCGENQNKQLGEGPANVRKMTKIKDVAPHKIKRAKGGYCHTLALTFEGTLLSLGCGEDGQRGDGKDDEGGEKDVVTEVMSNVKSFDAGANHSVAIKTDGSAWAWGSSEFGQCGVSEEGDRVLAPKRVDLRGEEAVDVTAGYAHTIIQTKAGKLLVIGQNDSGQLGLGAKSFSSPQDKLEATPIKSP